MNLRVREIEPCGAALSVDPPLPRDLSLTALRAFEAAARLGGFSAAAAELGVAPGAITAQVKALEGAVGVTLFERAARGVRLTAAGARAAPGLTAAFDRLRAAMATLRDEGAARTVHLAALPALAQLWLLPRLPALHAALPGTTLSVTAIETPPEGKRHPFDLLLFYDDVDEGRLAGDEVFPVCAPDLARRLSAPEDLSSVSCISDSA
ncbi:MAG TPA: LysR family transcriptional regulator, partial [Paracoccaceae bacterium]|nr:LysR family transcriptional regulator [Paracoccaceae bacterium]